MNHRFYCFKAIVISLVLIVVSADSKAQIDQNKPKESDPAVKKGLRFSVELVGGESLSSRSVLYVKLKLDNESKSAIYIYKQLGFGPGGFELTILDENNRWVPPNLIRETFPNPVLSKEDLQVIDPGKAIEDTISIQLFDYKITPGNYTLKIEYRSPVAPSSVTDGLTVLTALDGALKAKPIRFKVLVPEP